nr:hypothetical protein [Actinomycetota bacterium]
MSNTMSAGTVDGAAGSGPAADNSAIRGLSIPQLDHILSTSPDGMSDVAQQWHNFAGHLAFYLNSSDPNSLATAVASLNTWQGKAANEFNTRVRQVQQLGQQIVLAASMQAGTANSIPGADATDIAFNSTSGFIADGINGMRNAYKTFLQPAWIDCCNGLAAAMSDLSTTNNLTAAWYQWADFLPYIHSGLASCVPASSTPFDFSGLQDTKNSFVYTYLGAVTPIVFQGTVTSLMGGATGHVSEVPQASDGAWGIQPASNIPVTFTGALAWAGGENGGPLTGAFPGTAQNQQVQLLSACIPHLYQQPLTMFPPPPKSPSLQTTGNPNPNKPHDPNNPNLHDGSGGGGGLPPSGGKSPFTSGIGKSPFTSGIGGLGANGTGLHGAFPPILGANGASGAMPGLHGGGVPGLNGGGPSTHLAGFNPGGPGSIGSGLTTPTAFSGMPGGNGIRSLGGAGGPLGGG